MIIKQNAVKLNIALSILFCAIFPIIAGEVLNTYFPTTYTNIPLHSLLESVGGIIAIVIYIIFYIKFSKSSVFTHINWATTALLTMGIIDSFHAVVMPGKMFVWLHSIAVFFGGIFFISVWLNEKKVSSLVYKSIPLLSIGFAFLISISSILFPQFIPDMLNPDNSFTMTADLLNVLGGIGFFIASVRFFQIYIQKRELEELLFGGLVILFGTAGILFVSPVIWDMQWWLWHVLRLSAYFIAFYFLYSEYTKEVDEVESANITLRHTTKELKDNLAFFKSFKDATDAGNLVTKSDINGLITYVNDNFCNVTGYTRTEVIGRPHSIVRHPDTDKKIFHDMWQTIQAKKTWKSTLKNQKKNGGHYWVDITISPILDDDGNIVEYVAIRHDITELIDQRKELEKHANTDALTGIGNRFKLLNDIRNLSQPSLALINIDNFRELNDFYGHRFGDYIIIEVAKRLMELLGDLEGILLYRIQGDEYAVLNISKDRESFIKRISSIVSQLAASELNIQSEILSLQVTAALSFEEEKENLFLTADMMMKVAKREQKNLIVYDKSLALDKEYANNIIWAKKLKNALREDRLVPYYQPIINNHTGKWEKYESLVRIIDEDGKVISPFFFLEIAKRTKNYLELTRTVIQKSFETFKDMEVEFSINLTIQDIMDEELKVFIFTILEESKIGNKVVFEIVESEGIENFTMVLEFINEVKKFGCQIAIDDFGTGYSNFEYLIQLKADYIKIDGSMIKNIDKDANTKAVVSTIVDFAKKMNMKTIAEFVKDETIARIVKEMGIDYSQGFYFGEPKPKPETQLIEDKR